MNLLLSTLSVVIISLFSVVGIYLLFSLLPNFAKNSLFLVSLAVGSLLGDAFIHLFPEANSLFPSDTVSLLTITGILLFFLLEKVIRWRHCHSSECCEDHPTVTVSVVGDFFHNFLDGVLITSSFYVSLTLGLTTAIAVLIHEIPQEIGDFSVYQHLGVSLKRSLFLNLLSAASSLFGVLFVAVIGSRFQGFSDYILPVTAGGFIYLAASDLIPELHRHQSPVFSSLFQFFSVILGVLLMYLLKFIE